MQVVLVFLRFGQRSLVSEVIFSFSFRKYLVLVYPPPLFFFFFLAPFPPLSCLPGPWPLNGRIASELLETGLLKIVIISHAWIIHVELLLTKFDDEIYVQYCTVHMSLSIVDGGLSHLGEGKSTSKYHNQREKEKKKEKKKKKTSTL